RLSVLALAEYLGVNPSFLGSTIVGGSSFEYHVAHAMGAIGLGLCNVAVIAYGSTQRSVGRKQASVREVNPYETPSSHSYRPVPMRSPLRDTFMSSAQPASSLLPWRWQRANGRCLTRLRGRRSR